MDYRTDGFSVPLTITVDPALASPPTLDAYPLLTWDSASAPDDKVRLLLPERVRPPGSDELVAVPSDYRAYLLGQADAGAVLTDQTETTVDGRPALFVTVETSVAPEDSLGCGTTEQGPQCFGLQPDYSLRLGLIDVDDGRTLVTWTRTLVDQRHPEFFALFERMLGTIRFDTGRTPGSPPFAVPSLVTGTATPIDGTWTTSFTRDELAASPLLYDQGEVNDGNWGDLTFTFDHGTFTEELTNPTGDFSATGRYSVEDDLLLIVVDQGIGPETFGLRWSIDGDTLTFTRDPAQVGPTPFLVKPWTRAD